MCEMSDSIAIAIHAFENTDFFTDCVCISRMISMLDILHAHTYFKCQFSKSSRLKTERDKIRSRERERK